MKTHWNYQWIPDAGFTMFTSTSSRHSSTKALSWSSVQVMSWQHTFSRD